MNRIRSSHARGQFGKLGPKAGRAGVSLAATNRMGMVGIADMGEAVRHLVRCHLAGLRALRG